MRTLQQSKAAEQAVADELAKQGFQILAQNWKTPACEVDVIAAKQSTVYFVEVKFRQSLNQGGGFDYIGPAKLSRMDFAAKVWCAHNNWDGDYQQLAAAVSGEQYQNIDLVEIF